MSVTIASTQLNETEIMQA